MTYLIARFVGLVGLGFCIASPQSLAQPAFLATPVFLETEVAFQSGEVILSGTLLIPRAEGRHPALVMVHGAGEGLREAYRKEAEAFARAGIVTLVYDKRTEGYTASGLGPRSYNLLADDVLAAAQLLRARAEVDASLVGLWGLSEGAWVAPLAASRSDDIAFLVLIGASGVPPAQQEAWSMENSLRHQGVAGSLLHAMTRAFVRLLVAADFFPEARYDPVPVLERIQQPVLALWGEMDRTAVPAESAAIMAAALGRGGNPSYTVRFLPFADHDLRRTTDGFSSLDILAPGYIDTVTAWIEALAAGEAPGSSVADFPPQARLSPIAVIDVPWYETGGWLQLGVLGLLALCFGTYPFMALLQHFRQRHHGRALRVAPWLAATGLASVVGLFPYLVSLLMAGYEVGPLLAGRPLPWLALQGLAVTTFCLTAWLLLSWRRRRGAVPGYERVRLSLLALGGLVFIPWALHWRLVVP